MYQGRLKLEREIARAEQLGIHEIALILRSRFVDGADPEDTLAEFAEFACLAHAGLPG